MGVIMLAVAAKSHPVFRGFMPTEPRQLTTTEQALEIGAALRALRERAGIKQAQAAEAMGVTRQAFQQYESAGKAVVLRTDVQERLAAAIGLRREDILREAERRRGEPGGGALSPEGDGCARVYELPILGRVRTAETGPEIYDLGEPSSVVDVSWMFGPNARTLRAVGDAMSGYVENGQLVVFDTSLWPSSGEGCVVELHTGEVYVREYRQTAQGVLTVRQRNPDEFVSFPMNKVKGVYQIRFRGS